jgi:YbgC/YbaW family acyl-CoA thioester hydrolase
MNEKDLFLNDNSALASAPTTKAVGSKCLMFEYSFNVRGYELDSYGHVNHAVYFNYLEQARWELFHDLSLTGYFKENDLLLVVIEVHARYSREITLFDEVVVRTEVTKELPYLVFHHKMYLKKSNLKVCTATVKTLFTDKGKLVRDIPLAVTEKLIS